MSGSTKPLATRVSVLVQPLARSRRVSGALPTAALRRRHVHAPSADFDRARPGDCTDADVAVLLGVVCSPVGGMLSGGSNAKIENNDGSGDPRSDRRGRAAGGFNPHWARSIAPSL
jgi:hypothetical protein